MNDIAIYGFGGFGREVACMIKYINHAEPTWKLIGYFDDMNPIGAENNYGEVLGGLDALNNWDRPINIVIAISSPEALKTLSEKITNPLVNFPNLIGPEVTYNDRKTVHLGKGNIISSNIAFSCNIEFGDFNLVNYSACFGHDVRVGSFNSIGPKTMISGNVTIGDSNFIGVGAIIIEKLRIGNYTKIAAGAVLMRKTKDYSLYIGNPATKFKF